MNTEDEEDCVCPRCDAIHGGATVRLIEQKVKIIEEQHRELESLRSKNAALIEQAKQDAFKLDNMCGMTATIAQLRDENTKLQTLLNVIQRRLHDIITFQSPILMTEAARFALAEVETSSI